MASNSLHQQCSNQFIKAIEKQLAINIDNLSVTIFHVSKTISSTKPESYAPHQVGLGPYHHFQPHLYRMELQKLTAAKRVLNQTNQLLNSNHLVIRIANKLDPIIRSCYDYYIEFEANTLAWVVAIDALFLLDIFCSYCYSGKTVDFGERKLAQDIMMLENQIPLLLLREIQKSLKPNYDFGHEITKALQCSPDYSEEENHDSLYQQVLEFCLAHSPLKLADRGPFMVYLSSNHVLDFMYELIVNNSPQIPMVKMFGADIVIEAANQILNVAGLSATQNLFTRLINFPWDKILASFGMGKKNSDEANAKKIKVPSVSDLCGIAKVEFKTTSWGIGEIDFCEEEQNFTFYLPVIKLNVDSDVLLRNLVAYEELSDKKPKRLADYVDFMCGIIDSGNDVRLLREKNIVNGDLSDGEIVDLFNGVSKSISSEGNNESCLKKTIDKVNEYFDNKPRVKVDKLMKKCLSVSWKVLVIVSAMVVVLLLGFNAFCEVFGCRNRFFKKAAKSGVGLVGLSYL